MLSFDHVICFPFDVRASRSQIRLHRMRGFLFTRNGSIQHIQMERSKILIPISKSENHIKSLLN